MGDALSIPSFIAGFRSSVLGAWADLAPWALTADSERIVGTLLDGIDPGTFRRDGSVAVHRTATVEAGAILKGPAIIGPHCFVAAGAYLRGGTWLDERCILGPGAELKSSFVFRGSKLAHFNFVGDSILGADVNLEAGSIVANFRNEAADSEIRVRRGPGLVRTGVRKFGALIGDRARIGGAWRLDRAGAGGGAAGLSGPSAGT
jgi:NDP-sugar pyrophosphorylase family protein